MSEHPITHDEAIAFLTRDGKDLHVPCSRYGKTSAKCAEIAWIITNIIHEETGEPITLDALEYDMSLVVNNSDDVQYLLDEYGDDDEENVVELVPIFMREGSTLRNPYELYRAFVSDVGSLLDYERGFGIECVEPWTDDEEWGDHIDALEDAISDFGYTVEWANGYVIYGPRGE